MGSNVHVGFLRSGSGGISAEHPVLELSADEVRQAVGGISAGETDSTVTGTYDPPSYPYACCDGTKTCCCDEFPE